jgi:Ca-activated chloride channel family protein
MDMSRHRLIDVNHCNYERKPDGKAIVIAGAVTRRNVVLIVVVGLLVVATSQVGSAQGPATERQSPQITFKSGVEVVTVNVAVRDGHGKVVRDLKKADFEVIDSGFGREIRDFYFGDSPISLAILVDISGSMGVGGNMDRARDAVAVGMMNLRDRVDEATLFTFDTKLRQVVNFTNDLGLIRRVNLKGTPWGQTSLFDAIGNTARAVAIRANKHRALLVITDGVDTGSKLTAGDVSAIASAIDVPVYLLVVANPLDHPGGEFAVVATDGRETNTATLADLARWTGGDMRIASEPEHTVEAIQDLFAELRHQYLITFEPGERPGWHPLEIRTRKKNLVVHARSGYMSGPSRTESQ